MTPDQIHERVSRRWDLEGWPTPRPGWMACPVCRSPYWTVRYWRTHIRPGKGHRVRHRVDVHVKCTDCSAVWAHGLAIDEATHARLSVNGEYIWPNEIGLRPSGTGNEGAGPDDDA